MIQKQTFHTKTKEMNDKNLFGVELAFVSPEERSLREKRPKAKDRMAFKDYAQKHDNMLHKIFSYHNKSIKVLKTTMQ